MPVITENIAISTSGYCDIIDITPQLSKIVDSVPVFAGIVTVFVGGSTAGITTIEYEPGLLQDLPEVFEKLASMQQQYHHDATWGDGNGFSHIRAALLGASLTIPFRENKMTLGTWQQVVVIDFDNTSRKRNIIVQIIGE